MLHRASNYLLGTCLDAGRAAALALLDFWFPGLVPHLRRDFGRAASFSGSKNPLKPLGFQGVALVDDTGFEPVTFRTSSGCSSQLS